MKGAFSLFSPSGLYVRCTLSVCLQQRQCVGYLAVVSHTYGYEIVYPGCYGEHLVLFIIFSVSCYLPKMNVKIYSYVLSAMSLNFYAYDYD